MGWEAPAGQGCGQTENRGQESMSEAGVLNWGLGNRMTRGSFPSKPLCDLLPTNAWSARPFNTASVAQTWLGHRRSEEGAEEVGRKPCPGPMGAGGRNSGEVRGRAGGAVCDTPRECSMAH